MLNVGVGSGRNGFTTALIVCAFALASAVLAEGARKSGRSVRHDSKARGSVKPPKKEKVAGAEEDVAVMHCWKKDAHHPFRALRRARIMIGTMQLRGSVSIIVSPSDKPRAIKILRDDMLKHKYDAELVQ
ncbi:MAG: hypothetical protein ACK4UN_21395 [Limisphaerales bacterium]